MTYEGFGQVRLSTRPVASMKKNFGHIAGGTGITPLYQVFKAALKHKDGTSHSLIFGNRSVEDILLRDELEQLHQNNQDSFKLYLTVDQAPPKKVQWKDNKGVGFVTKDMIKERMPAPGEETMILICGPPVFTTMLTKILAELGYDDSMIFKF